ncbi:MAG: ADP-ribose pyrophosphatase [Desulfuromonas sp.]|nr:MAG: ADP-ribose pyrophosphatase [Desulfuromonas sp.]
MKRPLKRQTVFSGRVFEVGIETHQLPDGRQSEFEIVRHAGGAAVVPRLSNGELLLIRQFRPAIGCMVYEIPAGRVDPGETHQQCALRELQEETGYRAGRIQPLGGLLSAIGYCDEYVALFVADQLTWVGQQLESDEVLDVCPMTLAAALARLQQGEMTDSKTQVALLRLALLEVEEQKP